MEYTIYLQSEHWRTFRRNYILDCGYKCQICGIATKYLQVHHKTYKNIGKEQPEDVIAICDNCHNRTHGLKIEKFIPVRKKLRMSKKRYLKLLRRKENKRL